MLSDSVSLNIVYNIKSLATQQEHSDLCYHTYAIQQEHSNLCYHVCAVQQEHNNLCYHVCAAQLENNNLCYYVYVQCPSMSFSLHKIMRNYTLQ